MSTVLFCSWQSVKERVAAGLHITPDQLVPQWDTLCNRGVRDAAAELKRVFVLKGYTVGQLASSDDIRIWNERLGAFFAYVNGTTLASYDLKSVEHLDCRKEFMEAAALVIGDKAVAPTPNGSEIGGVSAGVLDGVAEIALDAELRGLFR